MSQTPPPVPPKSARRQQITPPTPPPFKDLPAIPSEPAHRPSIEDIKLQIARVSDEVLQPEQPRPDSPTRPELKSISYEQYADSSRPQNVQQKEKRLSGLMQRISWPRRKSSVNSQASFGSTNERLPTRRSISHDGPPATGAQHALASRNTGVATPTSIKSWLMESSGGASAADMHIVLISINSAREQHGSPPLVLTPSLCESAARYAKECAEQNKPPDRVINVVFQVRHMAWPGDGTRLQNAEILSDVENGEPLKVTRLVSAPLGALAVAERWISGKYKQHLTPVDPRVHLKFCQCLEFEAWKVIMNARYRKLGLARDEHGQWIAEFLVEAHHAKAIPLTTRLSSDTQF